MSVWTDVELHLKRHKTAKLSIKKLIAEVFGSQDYGKPSIREWSVGNDTYSEVSFSFCLDGEYTTKYLVEFRDKLKQYGATGEFSAKVRYLF